MIYIKREWFSREVIETLEKQIKSNEREQFFEWDFLCVWQELNYKSKFEAYKENFYKRIETSFDSARMLDNAIKEHEIVNLQYSLDSFYEDGIKKHTKLGYGIAINGENPNICDIIFNLKYEFDN